MADGQLIVEIEIPTLDDTARFVVPEKIRSEHIFRLKSKDIKETRAWSPFDLDPGVIISAI